MQRISKTAGLSFSAWALTVMVAGNVYAIEEVGWRDAQGNPIPEADHIRSSKGFGGSVLITPDADWKEKWMRPDPPQFTTTDQVKLGQSVMALVFFTNPATDGKGNVRILCDYQLVRPDNTLSEDVKDAPCAAGPLDGSPRNIRLVDQLVGFTGEASDLEGTWTIKVRLRDTIRGASVDLVTRFDYHKQ
jgi:hypothetical protein